MTETRRIELGGLARVEGEGALHLVFEGTRVVALRLDVFEPPRLFEAFLRGRSARELPDLVARICGICPAAYQMSVVHALEKIFRVEIDPRVRALRRLYYAGEWIESHVLHMVFLAAPDYLGHDDAFGIAREHRGQVERALQLRKTGNRLMELLGGRSVNPVGVCVGGFTRAPLRAEVEALGDELRHARVLAEGLLRWLASLPIPHREAEFEAVALRHPAEYPMNEGRLVSTRGLDCAVEEFERHFEESQVPHSTALHCRLRERGSYLVGPLARVLLNPDRLSPAASAALRSLAPRLPGLDVHASTLARAVEVVQAIDEALAVVEAYEPPAAPAAAWAPRAGVGCAATEAPRGVLWMRVETDARGDVVQIRIVPPTSQNQARIEEDLRSLAGDLAEASEERLRRACETLIRSYDPCISCSTHFLRVSIERRPGGTAVTERGE